MGVISPSAKRLLVAVGARQFEKEKQLNENERTEGVTCTGAVIEQVKSASSQVHDTDKGRSNYKTKMSNNQQGLQVVPNDRAVMNAPQQLQGVPNNPLPNDNNNNNNANPLPPGTVIVPPLPFQIPTDRRYFNRATGRVQLRVSKEGGSKRWICRAEGINGIFHTTDLFVVERHGRRGFRIYNVSADTNNTPNYSFEEEDARLVGDVQRTAHFFGGFIEYKLVRRQLQVPNKLESTAIMKTTSLGYPVVNGYADRIVYSVIHDHSVEEEDQTDDTESCFADSCDGLCFDALNNKPVVKHIHDDIHQVAQVHPQIKVLQSKRRFTNAFGKKLHRDLEPYQQKFLGRALRASKKNLQIMDVSSGKVMLQVGRLSKTDFALDFLPPYTPFQALGLFLAQVDAN